MDGDVRGGWERRRGGGGDRGGLCLKDSHEELRRRWVVTGGSGLPEAIAGKFLTLELVGISFSGQSGHLLLELFHLLDQLGLLVLQMVLLLDSLIPAGLGIAPVLQRPPLLLEADHLVLGEAPQVPVELPHRHGDQLFVREPVFHAVGGRVLLVGVLQLLGGGGGGGRGGRRLVMVVVVMVMVMRVPAVGQVFVGDPRVLVVVLLLVMVVVVGPEALKALQLLGHLVGPDEGFHRVLRGEAERLGVHLLVAVGHPVQVLQVGLLLGGAEAGRGGHRAAGRADGSRGDGAGRLQAGAVAAGPVGSAQRLLLHVEFHQVEVVDVLHGQGAGGQLGSDAQLAGHGCLAGASGWSAHSRAPSGGRAGRAPSDSRSTSLLLLLLAEGSRAKRAEEAEAPGPRGVG